MCEPLYVSQKDYSIDIVFLSSTIFVVDILQDVACVVHYQLPASADMYVHRCGRTARAAAEGIALALVTPKESARFSSLRKVRPVVDRILLVVPACTHLCLIRAAK